MTALVALALFVLLVVIVAGVAVSGFLGGAHQIDDDDTREKKLAVRDRRARLDAGSRLGVPPARLRPLSEKIHGLDVRPVAPARKGIKR